MKILQKYILKEFFKVFFPISCFLIAVFALSEFFWRLPDFISHKPPVSLILYYLSLHVPLWFVQTLPVVIMLSCLLTITHLQYTNELISIQTLGINIKIFFLSFIFLGLIFSLISFYVYDNIATKFFNKAQNIFETQIKKIPKIGHLLNKLFYYDLNRNTFILIEEYNTNNKYLKNVLIEQYKNDFLEQQIFASGGYKEKDNIVVNDCMICEYKDNKYKKQYVIKTFKYPVSVDIEQFQFDYANMQLDMLNIEEIKKIINFVKYKGESISKFLTEINFRYAVAFLNLVVGLLAIPLGKNVHSRYGSLISFLYTIVVLIIYWSLLAIIRSICEVGILAPVYVWLPNALFFLIGLILYIVK